MKKEMVQESEGKEMVIPSMVYNSLIGVIWAGIIVFGVGIALSESEIKLGGLISFSIATAAILWLLYDTIHQNNKLQGKKSSLGMNMAIIGVITEVVIVMVYSINQVQGKEDTISNQLDWVLGGGILIILGVFFELFLIDVAIMKLVRGFTYNVYHVLEGITRWVIKKGLVIFRIGFTIMGIILIVGAIFAVPTNESLERLAMAIVGTIFIFSWNWEVVKSRVIQISIWTKKRWRGISTTILIVFSVVAWFLPMSLEIRAISSLLSFVGVVALNWTTIKLALYELGKRMAEFLKNAYLLIKNLVSDIALWTKKRWRGISTTLLIVFSVVVWFLPMSLEIRTVSSLLSFVGVIALNWTAIKLALYELGKGLAEFFKGFYSIIKELIKNIGTILKAAGNVFGIILLILSVIGSDPYFNIYFFLSGALVLLLANNKKVILTYRHNKTLVSDLTGLSILYFSIIHLSKIDPEWLAYTGYFTGIVLLLLGHTFFKKFAQEIIRILYSSVQTITELIQTTVFAMIGIFFFVFAFSVIIDNPLFGLDLSEYDTISRTILGVALAFIGGFSFKFAQTRYYVEKGGKRK